MSVESNVETATERAAKNSRETAIRECTRSRVSIQKVSGVMSDWHKLIAADDLPVGCGKEFAVSGRIVALFNVDGQFQAIDGICAHQGGPLAKGQLVEGVVTCPWHGWQFQVASGQHCLSPRICQTTFEVKLEAGDVFVRV